MAPKPTRRKIIQSIAAGTITSSGFVGIGAASDDERKIVSGHLNDGRVATDIVSEEWYQHLQEVRDVQENLRRKFETKSWFDSIRRVVTESEINGMKKYQIKVMSNNPPRARNEVPKRRRGVSIEVEKRTPQKHRQLDGHYDDSWCNNEPRSCMEAGDAISTSYADVDNGDTCNEQYDNLTMTSPVSRNGETYMMTCAHGFMDNWNCDTNIMDELAYSGTCAYQGNRNYIGNVDYFDYELDFALTSTYGDISPEMRNRGNDIMGYTTEDGIDRLASEGTTVFKYGARSCHNKGVVEGFDSQNRCGKNNWVQVTTHAASGDSGAPHYEIRMEFPENPNMVIGHHVRHYTDNNGNHTYSFAPPAYMVSNNHDISFGGGTC